MERFFLPILQWQTCLVYLDDVIVYARDFDEHLEWPKEVFERFQQADLKLKPLKRIPWPCDLSSRCEHWPREDGSWQAMANTMKSHRSERFRWSGFWLPKIHWGLRRNSLPIPPPDSQDHREIEVVTIWGKAFQLHCGIQRLELSCLNLCSICKFECAVFRWGLCPISQGQHCRMFPRLYKSIGRKMVLKSLLHTDIGSLLKSIYFLHAKIDLLDFLEVHKTAEQSTFICVNNIFIDKCSHKKSVVSCSVSSKKTNLRRM